MYTANTGRARLHRRQPDGYRKDDGLRDPDFAAVVRDPHGIYAVILTPTRELALQIFEQFQAIGSPQSLKVCLITGGTEARPQAVALAQRPHIVVATPDGWRIMF